MQKKFNASFINTRALPTGGPIEPVTPSKAASATAAPVAKAFSPELGQKFNNGSRRYRTTFNDPNKKYSVITDDRGEEIHIPYHALQRVVNNKVGTMDLSRFRKFKGGESAYYRKHTDGGINYVAPAAAAQQRQSAANSSWDTYAKSQRPTGSYHADGRAASIENPDAAVSPVAANYYPVTKAYRKGGLMVKPAMEFGDSPTKKKIPKAVKLIAKKEKCGGKMKAKKMAGGKMPKKAGDCGCK